jgi:hypothetical protein
VDMSASAIPDLFDMHINAAVRWVQHAKRTGSTTGPTASNILLVPRASEHCGDPADEVGGEHWRDVRSRRIRQSSGDR